jgi:hypothetical protein
MPFFDFDFPDPPYTVTGLVTVIDGGGDFPGLGFPGSSNFLMPHVQLGVVPQVTQVTIDIKPGAEPNSINLFSGVLPVAILTTSSFDAATVNPATVTLAGALARVRGRSTKRGSLEDVDNDGDLDLILHVFTEETALTPGDVEAVLTGRTFAGVMIEGRDSIRIVP